MLLCILEINYILKYIVGVVGFEPTQPKALDLQSSPPLQLWRTPYSFYPRDYQLPVTCQEKTDVYL